MCACNGTGSAKVLPKDMSNFNSTLPDWEIKLSTTKPVSSVFHLHYKEPSVSLRYTSMVNHCQFDPTSNPLD